MQEEWKEMKNHAVQAPPLQSYPATVHQWQPTAAPAQIPQENNLWY